MRPIHVLVVDDSAFIRRALERMLAGAPEVRVVGEASDGRAALELVEQFPVDVVLLDLGLPVVDGLEVLETLRRLHPQVAVVVVSAATSKGAEATARALALGAFDVVDKSAVPAMEVHALTAELLAKVRAAARRGGLATEAQPELVPADLGVPELVVVGASTGGPAALMAMVRALRPGFPAPVVVVQHMPATFLEPFARRLGEEAGVEVVLARPGIALRPGVVYVAPSGRDARPARQGASLSLVAAAPRPGAQHVPSVDTLFFGAAAVAGPRAWGLLLTGMGEDGAAGLSAMREAGGFTVAQDEASCAVFGMPGAAIERGAARAVLSLSSIVSLLARAAPAPSPLTIGPMGGP